MVRQNWGFPQKCPLCQVTPYSFQCNNFHDKVGKITFLLLEDVYMTMQ